MSRRQRRRVLLVILLVGLPLALAGSLAWFAASGGLRARIERGWPLAGQLQIDQVAWTDGGLELRNVRLGPEGGPPAVQAARVQISGLLSGRPEAVQVYQPQVELRWSQRHWLHRLLQQIRRELPLPPPRVQWHDGQVSLNGVLLKQIQWQLEPGIESHSWQLQAQVAGSEALAVSGAISDEQVMLQVDSGRIPLREWLQRLPLPADMQLAAALLPAQCEVSGSRLQRHRQDDTWSAQLNGHWDQGQLLVQAGGDGSAWQLQPKQASDTRLPWLTIRDQALCWRAHRLQELSLTGSGLERWSLRARLAESSVHMQGRRLPEAWQLQLERLEAPAELIADILGSSLGTVPSGWAEPIRLHGLTGRLQGLTLDGQMDLAWSGGHAELAGLVSPMAWECRPRELLLHNWPVAVQDGRLRVFGQQLGEQVVVQGGAGPLWLRWSGAHEAVLQVTRPDTTWRIGILSGTLPANMIKQLLTPLGEGPWLPAVLSDWDLRGTWLESDLHTGLSASVQASAAASRMQLAGDWTPEAWQIREATMRVDGLATAQWQAAGDPSLASLRWRQLQLAPALADWFRQQHPWFLWLAPQAGQWQRQDDAWECRLQAGAPRLQVTGRGRQWSQIELHAMPWSTLQEQLLPAARALQVTGTASGRLQPNGGIVAIRASLDRPGLRHRSFAGRFIMTSQQASIDTDDFGRWQWQAPDWLGELPRIDLLDTDPLWRHLPLPDGAVSIHSSPTRTVAKWPDGSRWQWQENGNMIVDIVDWPAVLDATGPVAVHLESADGRRAQWQVLREEQPLWHGQLELAAAPGGGAVVAVQIDQPAPALIQRLLPQTDPADVERLVWRAHYSDGHRRQVTWHWTPKGNKHADSEHGSGIRSAPGE